MIRKVLICNRGEIALRIIRACRDLGIRSVVAHSSADRDSLPVRYADETVCIGPGAAARSYNNIPAVLYACAKTHADAVHPGYGFLSEDPSFADACREVGLTFIGPSPEHIAMMGDKIAARRAMIAAGVPVLPGSDGPVPDLAEARAVADEIGYPVILKAAAGGGGRGIGICATPEDMPDVFGETRAAAGSLFQDDRVFVERYVTDGRHIEVQVLGDKHGRVVHLGDRDCSVQRRHQKLVEEAPAPGLPDDLRMRLAEAAVAGASAIGYFSAGTFEFLVEPNGDAYFIEMNTRLQVEHPVTESVTGFDLVAWMIRIAAGEPLGFDQEEVAVRGHSIEVRINAEDAARNWAASAGRINFLHLPGGPGMRIDSHVFDGYVVPPFYDSLLAKLIATGADRPAALRTLNRALAEFELDGVCTNVEFHRELLRRAEFQAGEHRLGVVEAMSAGRRTQDLAAYPASDAPE